MIAYLSIMSLGGTSVYHVYCIMIQDTRVGRAGRRNYLSDVVSSPEFVDELVECIGREAVTELLYRLEQLSLQLGGLGLGLLWSQSRGNDGRRVNRRGRLPCNAVDTQLVMKGFFNHIFQCYTVIYMSEKYTHGRCSICDRGFIYEAHSWP